MYLHLPHTCPRNKLATLKLRVFVSDICGGERRVWRLWRDAEANAEAIRNDLLSYFFLMLVVQRVVHGLFPSFSVVLLSLKELMVLDGLFILCVSLFYELFLAFWYWVAFLWVLQEYSLFLEWHWSLYKMALSTTQHCGSTTLFISFVFLFHILAFPMWWRASSIRFCGFFLMPKGISISPLISSSWPSVLFYYILRLKKQPGYLSLSRAVVSTCGYPLDELGKERHFQDTVTSCESLWM